MKEVGKIFKSFRLCGTVKKKILCISISKLAPEEAFILYNLDLVS